jgi:hypothetical protein
MVNVITMSGYYHGIVARQTGQYGYKKECIREGTWNH